MAYQVQVMRCPSCGADVKFDDGRTQGFCSFCGAKVVVSNENEYIYRHIDEAGIKQAEVRMRELDLQEKKEREAAEKKIAAEEQARQQNKKTLIIAGALAALGLIGLAAKSAFLTLFLFAGVIVFFVGRAKRKKEQEIADGKIMLPSILDDYENMNYMALEHQLRSAGFTNISCIEKKDLTFGLLKKPGLVESVIVDGSETCGGARFMPDVAITITYHSLNR